MTESILLTVKKMLGIAEEYHAFDLDLIIDINSVFLTLNQLGVGPESPFQITGDSEVWSGFANPKEVPGIQTYVYLKTRLLFDPPTNSFLVTAIEKQIAEFEWRLNVQVDTEYPEKEEESVPTEPEPTVPDTSVTPPSIESGETESNPKLHLVSMRRKAVQAVRAEKPPTSETVREAIARLRKSKLK